MSEQEMAALDAEAEMEVEEWFLSRNGRRAALAAEIDEGAPF